jgi:LysR family hydrogen peroxide-inducible transcriptional activator
VQLRAIRYFVALSETLNFTKAAELCHVSPPALTRAIQKLEEQVGGLLVSRERHNTHLTALGMLVEPHLREVLAQARQAKRLATSFMKLDQAGLSLGVMCTIGPMHFHELPGAFPGASPGRGIDATRGRAGPPLRDAAGRVARRRHRGAPGRLRPGSPRRGVV